MENPSSTLVADLRVRCRAGEDWACQQLEFQKPVGEPQRFAEGGYVGDEEMAKDPDKQNMESFLSPDEEEILFKALKDNPALIGVFRKFLQAPQTNTEEPTPETYKFQDGGEVDGPGTGTSDSIDAKLSDGEFVFTAKAVKQIGLGKLQSMMNKAEQEFDAGSQGTPTDQQMKTLLNSGD